MAQIPSDVVRINMVWGIVNGQEIAVNTVHLKLNHHSGNPVDWGSLTQQACDGFASRLQGHWGQGMAIGITNTAHMLRVDAYHLDNDAKTLDKATHSLGNPGLTGADAGPPLPPSVSCVLQLWGYPPTGFVRDSRSHRGRLFLPALNNDVLDTEGMISPGFANGFSQYWGSFLGDVQGMVVDTNVSGLQPDYWDVGILSRTRGLFSNLRAVTCARVPAVQRRRVNKLVRARTNPTNITQGS